MTHVQRLGWPVAFAALGALALGIAAVVSGIADAGPLDPPPPAGGPTGTQKTQNEIEPRTPISSLPFTISTSGSYYLTGNLTGVAGAHGITISVSDVTLDLNGFALIGVAGSVNGVNVSPGTNTHILNGTVRDWDGHGVQAFSALNSRVENLRSFSNGGSGISIGSNSTVTACEAYLNGGTGVEAGQNSSIIACTAQANSANGFTLSTASVISDCTARNNGGDGIDGTTNAIIKGCVAMANLNDGIQVNSGAYVTGNNSTVNGLGGADGAGIHATGANNRIDGNHVTINDRGIDVDAAGNTIVRNSASGNTTEYDIVAGNDTGPITTAAAATSPWSNVDN